MSAWYPGEYAEPYYPRFFRVIDIASWHLGPERRVFWRKCRDAGLGMWKPGATFRLRWAQNVSDATATRMLTNSTLWAVKLA